MKRILVLAVLLGAGVASANPSKIMVLQSEGRADVKVRQKIDATLVKLARTGNDTILPGEITYSDAAALVGCKPEEASCKDEVIGTLAVDEIVITNVMPKPGGFEVSVRRVGKGGATREATVVVPADGADKLEALSPVFGGKAPPTGPTPPPTGPTPPPTGPTPPKTEPTIGPKPPDATPPHDQLPDLTAKKDPVVETPPADKRTATPEEPAKPLDQPVGHDDQPRDRRKLYLAGMAGGGGMMLLGFILWANASGVENDVENFRVTDRRSLEDLRALEDKGDTYAAWGNVLTIGGLVLGGVSTYFYLKDRRARKASTSARLAPALFDHGGGISLTFGGTP